MKILSKRYEKWGIDVDVLITDSQNTDHIITMHFSSNAQFEKEISEREKRAVLAQDTIYQEEINKIDEKEVQKKVEALFASKGTITKAEYESIKASSKPVSSNTVEKVKK